MKYKYYLLTIFILFTMFIFNINNINAIEYDEEKEVQLFFEDENITQVLVNADEIILTKGIFTGKVKELGLPALMRINYKNGTSISLILYTNEIVNNNYKYYLNKKIEQAIKEIEINEKTKKKINNLMNTYFHDYKSLK